MRTRRADCLAIALTLLAATPALAQFQLNASGTVTQASWPAAATPGGTGPQVLYPPGARAVPAESAAKNGFVWEDRPSLQYGKSFRMDITLLLVGDVRESSVDLTQYGGTTEWENRRAGVKGTFLKWFEYQVEHDLSSDGEWRDVFLNVRPVAWAQVQGGKFKIPFGYERLTSPADLDFVKRSRVSDALTPGREVGVMVHGRVFKRVLHYRVGYFDGQGDQSPALQNADLLPDEQPEKPGRTWAGRVTVAPLRLGSVPGKYNNLEIGGAMASTDIPEGENHLHGKTLVGASFFSRHYFTHGSRVRTGIEASWPIGPASVNAEYIRSREERLGLGVGNETQLDNDLPELEGKGWYVAGTWLITGEKKEGGVKPRRPLLQGGYGAIEVAARYEQLRFSSDGGPSEPPSRSKRAATIEGNGDRATTIGVNWYVNKWVKVRADYIREQLDNPARGPAPDQSSFWTFVTQFQLVF